MRPAELNRRGDADDVIALMRQSLIRVSQTQDKFGVVYGMIPLAAAAALKGDHAWVARILGARDAITERAGSTLIDPLMREVGERIERNARERLGPDAWARSHAEGSRSSVESMLKDIDRAIGVASSPEHAASCRNNSTLPPVCTGMEGSIDALAALDNVRLTDLPQ